MAKRVELTQHTGPYHAGWDHLNQHEFVANAVVLAHRNMQEDDESYGFTQRVIIKGPFNPKDPEQVKRIECAIHSRYRQSCRCEHDCCGCFNGGADGMHIKGREFLARAFYTRNI